MAPASRQPANVNALSGSLSGSNPAFMRQATIGLAARAAAGLAAGLLLAGASRAFGAEVAAGHSNAPAAYVPDSPAPQVLTNSGVFSYPSTQTLIHLLWIVSVPTNWALVSASGHGSPEIGPNRRDILFLGDLSPNPIRFQYTIQVPAHASGAKELRAQVEYQFYTMKNPARIWAAPDPLPVPELARDYYVAPGGAHQAPYTNWLLAATTLQAAVDAAAAGPSSSVWVSNGAYRVTAPVVVTSAVCVRGLSGAIETTLQGDGAARVLEIAHSQAVVCGFTIGNGAAGPSGSGGGVRVGPGLLRDCRVLGNSAGQDGGGADVGSGGVLRNCLVWGNAAGARGGGVRLDGGALEHCTVCANTAGADGGGVYAGGPATSACVNGIVYDNAAGSGGSNWSVAAGGTWRVSHTCMAPATGPGCEPTALLDADPRLKGLPEGDCRLDPASPCINAALPLDWAADATDLDGRPRRDRLYRRADMGAYERLAQGFMWSGF